MNDSYSQDISRCAHQTRDIARIDYLLVNVELAEDLGRIQEVLVLEDPNPC